jgi:hypothetical protein
VSPEERVRALIKKIDDALERFRYHHEFMIGGAITDEVHIKVKK